MLIGNVREAAADADRVEDVKNPAFRDVYDHGGWLGLSISEDHVAARENTLNGHLSSSTGARLRREVVRLDEEGLVDDWAYPNRIAICHREHLPPPRGGVMVRGVTSRSPTAVHAAPSWGL